MAEFVDFQINLDLSDPSVREWGGTSVMVAPGTYDLEIINVAQKEAKTSGKPGLLFTFRVLGDGPDAGKDIVRTYSLEPKALGRLKSLGRAIGANLSVFIAAEYVGRQFTADIIHKMMPAQGPGPDGLPGEARPSMDVVNERSLDGVEAAAPPPPPAPTNGNGKRPVVQGAPRPNAARR